MKKNRDFLGNLQGCLETLAITGVFFLVGAGLTWWGWVVLQNARASSSWPTVPGQITESEMDFSTDSEGGDSFTPRVTYIYAVNGLSYESYTIKFGENTYGSERQANEILARYPVGQAVTVYYDPSDPDRTVLEPGVSGGSYILLGVGLLFLGIAFIPFPIFLFRFFFGTKG